LDLDLIFDDYLRVWIRTERGTGGDVVAQYGAIVRERFYPRVRYEGSH
jgi:hypothetical protein